MGGAYGGVSGRRRGRINRRGTSVEFRLVPRPDESATRTDRQRSRRSPGLPSACGDAKLGAGAVGTLLCREPTPRAYDAWRMDLQIVTGAPDGRTLDVYIGGPEGAVPLLFHNGTPSSGQLYSPFVEAASQRDLRMVSFSRAG